MDSDAQPDLAGNVGEPLGRFWTIGHSLICGEEILHRHRHRNLFKTC